MLYCCVLYLAVCVGGGVGAGGYLLAELGDDEVDTKEQHDNIRFADKHTLLPHKIIFFSEGKITPVTTEKNQLYIVQLFDFDMFGTCRSIEV